MNANALVEQRTPTEKLLEFVANHTTMTARENNAPGTMDVGYFRVNFIRNPQSAQFKNFLAEYRITPFDGMAHDYLSIGGWLGLYCRNKVLCFMALAAHLGMGKILTPRSQLGDEDMTIELERKLLDLGMLSIHTIKVVQ